MATKKRHMTLLVFNCCFIFLIAKGNANFCIQLVLNAYLIYKQ